MAGMIRTPQSRPSGQHPAFSEKWEKSFPGSFWTFLRVILAPWLQAFIFCSFVAQESLRSFSNYRSRLSPSVCQRVQNSYCVMAVSLSNTGD